MITKWPLLREKDIDVKRSPGGRLILEKNSHIDVEILDKVVGPDNWQSSYKIISNELFCDISIFDEKKKEWIHKEGLGFRGAATLWGIGRELFDISKLLTNGKQELLTNGKQAYFVKKITYKNKKAVDLVICEENGKEVFNKSKETLKTQNYVDLPAKDEEKPCFDQEKPPIVEITLSKPQITELLALSKKIHGDNSSIPLNQFMVALKCKTPYQIRAVYYDKMKKYIENWETSSIAPNLEVPE